MHLRRAAPLAAVAMILLVAYPTLSVPEAVAPSHPQTVPPPVRFEGGVKGFVLSDAGSPLWNAWVTATGNGVNQTSFTGPDGSYLLGLPAGQYQLTAGARAHASRNATVLVLGELPVEQNFTLDHTGPVLKGTVRDAKTGAGLGKAQVEVQVEGAFGCKPDAPCPLDARPGFYVQPYLVMTGPEGGYAVAVEQGGNAGVRAWRDGYREAWELVAIDGDTVLDLQLQPFPPKSAVLQGTVRDAKAGKPIESAWVSAWPSQPRAAAEPPAGAEPSSGTMPSPTVVCPDGGDCPEPCCTEGNSSQTDAEGRFRMDMYPGEYTLSVGAPGYGQHQEQVSLPDGETVTREVELEPIPGDTVLVRGVVVDKGTGKPLGGVGISVENQQWGHYNGTSTDENGRFELRTKPGWSLVWVRSDGGGYAYPVAQRDVASAGSNATPSSSTPPPPSEPPRESVIAPEPYPPRPKPPEQAYYPWVQGRSFADGEQAELRVELQPKPKADVRIVGYVVDLSTNKAIAGATVNLRNEDTGDWGWAQTDEHGSFVIQGRPGVHTVQAYGEGFFGNAVVVEVKAPETRVDIGLQPGRASGYCCVVYAGDKAAAAAQEGPAGAPAPTAPGSGGTSGAEQDRSLPLRGEGPASYQGLDESLGPYDPARAPAPGGSTPGTRGTAGFEALALLGAVAAGAMLARRRR